jgi:hypothetical protein
MKVRKRVKCKNCKKQFTTSSLTTKTCSPACRKALQRKSIKVIPHICTGYLDIPCPEKKVTKAERCRNCKRIHGRMMSFFNTSFGSLLANELIGRAGSVELIDGMSGLQAYFEAYKLRAQANPIKNGKVEINYHIAHRVAVREPSGLRKGMYSKENLIVVPAKQNQSFGNKDIFIGAEPDIHFRWTSSLDSKLFVNEDTTHKELRLLLISHLGSEFIDWVDKTNLPRRAKKAGDFSSEGLSSIMVAKAQAEGAQLAALSIKQPREESKEDTSKEAQELKKEAFWDGYINKLSPDEQAHEQHFQKLTGLEFWDDCFTVGYAQDDKTIQPKPEDTSTDGW